MTKKPKTKKQPFTCSIHGPGIQLELKLASSSNIGDAIDEIATRILDGKRSKPTGAVPGTIHQDPPDRIVSIEEAFRFASTLSVDELAIAAEAIRQVQEERGVVQ